jgi:hypothetical protein
MRFIRVLLKFRNVQNNLTHTSQTTYHARTLAEVRWIIDQIIEEWTLGGVWELLKHEELKEGGYDVHTARDNDGGCNENL